MVDKVITSSGRNIPAVKLILARKLINNSIAAQMLEAGDKHSELVRARKLPSLCQAS